jgi:Sel1 repeat-containing protein
MNLTPSTALRAALLPRLPLARLAACLLFCCLMLKLAGASAEDNGLLQKASSGDSGAEVALGIDYQKGLDGFPRDMRQAAYWYMKAADQGAAWGEFDIGLCYGQGTCEQEDYRQEYTWVRKAADQNLPRAQCTVAYLYLYGWGVTADRQEAQSWFEKAGGARGCADVPSNLWAPLASAPVRHFLPCQIAQNADRPCTNQEQSYVPTGVDGGLVGTWEIVTPTPAGIARWVWEIHKDGTYRFHAEGPGAVQAHRGTFAASNGHYLLNSTTIKWNDAGTYQLEDSATLLATGKLGSGTWHRVQPKVTGHGGPQRITVRK